MNRDMLARYGLRVSDGEEALKTALLGKLAAKMVDEQGRLIDILVRPDISDNANSTTLTIVARVDAGTARRFRSVMSRRRACWAACRAFTANTASAALP